MAIIKFKGDPSVRELRQFAAIWFPLFWTVVAGWLYYWGGSLRGAALALAIGIAIGGIGFAKPAFMRPVFLGWMFAAYPIGWVVSHAILATVFYVIMTPIGLVMKLVGYDPLQRQLLRSSTSYWIPVEAVDSKASYFRQF